ncbi:hypothetical protein HKK55_08090 [Pseudomonas sp. ADAK18]|uniref:hypothetical protein n=1 Tax=Pseudomonas sp. ADAK18 TaxID=2730848 RepID=UPI0014628C54|nr:hypothetical protein [Pseudomonas sp. ADAK18]QJI28678.1 hypothetical protein HKK55_08090 [Pseudomonas sp. ADAK18]
MYATKLTLILLGALLYLLATLCWFLWLGPELVGTGSVVALIGAFGGTCTWLLVTFGLAIHIIKTARPAAGSFEKPEA